MTNHESYALLDSGQDAKLERFGEYVLARPASLCMWQRRQPQSVWNDADATYENGQWRFNAQRGTLDSWKLQVGMVTLELRLQQNGQIGFFPEHNLYMSRLKSLIENLRKRQSRQLRILNLFAYTGLATIFAAKCGAVVTHVDMSKKANEWARHNFSLNKIERESVRVIEEDVLSFLKREERRGSKYDIVLADPPSFSRISKTATWNLDEKLLELTNLCCTAMEGSTSALIFTNHSSFYSAEIVRNLCADFFSTNKISHFSESLTLPEQDTNRALPAGALIEVVVG